MKRMASFIMVLAVCVQVSAEMYLLECTEYGYVYDPSGVQLDTSMTNISITLDVITELEKGDNPKRILRLSINDVKINLIRAGESYLARSSEAIAATNDLGKNLGPIRRQEFILTSTGELTIRTHDNKKVLADSWDIIQELWPQFVKAGAHITIMMPADYLKRVSWLVDVPEDMRTGERLTVPFRTLSHKKSFFSPKRTTSLVCTQRTGNILTLESNREKHSSDDKMLIWHVQVDYDVQKQLPIKIIDNRFKQLVEPGNGNIHTTREEITLRPLQIKK